MSISLDEDLVILENLDFDPTCGAVVSGCDNKAEWIMTTRCCSSEYLYCVSHREKYIRYLKYRMTTTTCRVCRFKYDSQTYVNHVWTPI